VLRAKAQYKCLSHAHFSHSSVHGFEGGYHRCGPDCSEGLIIDRRDEQDNADHDHTAIYDTIGVWGTKDVKKP